ncbi:MAG: hypothetical protein R2741_01695 [Methanolobus sp.]
MLFKRHCDIFLKWQFPFNPEGREACSYFLGHLCRNRHQYKKCVDIARKHSDVRIACTRKTTPGLRKYEKMAVIAGGGDPQV